jgi:hypothetical protein
VKVGGRYFMFIYKAHMFYMLGTHISICLTVHVAVRLAFISI